MKNTFLLIVLTWSFNLSAQSQIDAFFEDADSLLHEYVVNGAVNYLDLKDNTSLASLVNFIGTFDYESLTVPEKKAYLINAYNLLVIHEAVTQYPISSVQDIPGFFDGNRIEIGGKKMTLNDFEKKEILNAFEDARLHFVLVCAAVSCPPITNFAYRPDMLEQQIENQTKLALNDDSFIWIEGDVLNISQIFRWYASDFGNTKASIIKFINLYRSNSIPTSSSLKYYDYNWNLNATSTANGSNPAAPNATRYIVSSTIPVGQIELKIFNNLYSQVLRDQNRSSFFTTSTSFLYGINRRFNLGFSSSYRRVLNSGIPSSPFDIINRPQSGQFRQGITAFGPQIRWAPYPKWQNFSIQSRFVFPTGRNLSGSAEQPFIDWGGPSFFNQFFNDIAIGTRFSLFTEVGLHWEDIGLPSRGRINQVSTPLTGILSFSPNGRTILYALANFSPFYRIPFDFFVQGGVGGKYQFTRNIEIELLYTGFTNRFLLSNNGGAATYNVGFRFNI